jgi:hypothetical protein
MRVFIAPLNWGLGHATRCVPLIERYRREGHEVILGGDGDSLLWLKRRFPTLKIEPLSSLRVRYSASRSQVGAMLRMLPDFIRFIREDHLLIQSLQNKYCFDLIISDNRFGLFLPPENRKPKTVYLTHQLQVRLPRGWRWAEPLARRIHAAFYRRYDEVWVPDYADTQQSLAGWLSHPAKLPANARYIGPLSRFTAYPSEALANNSPFSILHSPFSTVALLSGPEPQRSLLEQDLIRRFEDQSEPVLIVRGKISGPRTQTVHQHITLVPRLEDEPLVAALNHCSRIIARSGYTTVMDLDALHLLHKAELIPTPGQSEQEYLAAYLRGRQMSE